MNFLLVYSAHMYLIARNLQPVHHTETMAFMWLAVSFFHSKEGMRFVAVRRFLSSLAIAPELQELFHRTSHQMSGFCLF